MILIAALDGFMN